MTPLAMLLRWLLGREGVPYMARPTFRREVTSTLLRTVAIALLIPQFTGLFAEKGLGAARWILPLLQAQAAVGNLLMAFASPWLRGLRRVRVVVWAQTGVAGAMILVALLPARQASSIPFALAMLIPALLMAVVLNSRTGVWHSNFPEAVRGRLFSRLHMTQLGTQATVALAAAAALDAWEGAHHVLYPIGAVCLLGSSLAYSRIRVRRERGQIAASRARRPRLLEGLAVLVRDREFGKFMFWQMISGSAVLMSAQVFVASLIDEFGVSYKAGSTALMAVPFLVSMFTLPMAGAWFDRISITRFRALNAGLWTLSRALVWVALIIAGATIAWPLALLGFAVQGMGMGLGGMAFSIGHTRYARPHDTQVYMGAHMTLQGVRGLTMPFVGIALYQWDAVGIHVLGIGVAIQAIAAIGFYRLPDPARVEGTRAGATDPDDGRV